MAKKSHADKVAERSARAGYKVKDHGHRFFQIRVKVDTETGEMYLPDGYKFVEFLSYDFEDTNYAYLILKDEHLG